GAYQPLLAEAGLSDMLRRNGSLLVFESDAKFAATQPYLELQRRRGIVMDILAAEEIRQLEPSLAPIFRHAVFHRENGHGVDDFRLAQALAADVVRRGGLIRPASARGFTFGPAGPPPVLTASGAAACPRVVRRAGASPR